MPRNEEGEFELVLGNKQLLTVFFIVVVLLGIFATMGYIVGRSSSPGPIEAAKGEPPPLVVDSRSEAAKAEPARPSGLAGSDLKAVAAENLPTATSGQVAQPRATPDLTPQPTFGEPNPGQTFLQVVAVPRADAELVSEILMKKGFRAVIAPAPSDAKLFRVLVGPLKDTADIAKTRADLEAAGFKGPLMRKY